MNKIEYFLQRKLENCSKYVLTDLDKKVIRIEGIQEYIYKKLKSKKYRKTSMEDGAIEQVKKAIELNVSNNKPIRFLYPFGGYKIWRLPSYPEVDWAEFFSILYVVEYVSSIASAYESGVEIIFSSDDIVITEIDNYPKRDLEKYVKSFYGLLEEIKKYLPTNITVRLERVGELYDEEEYKRELNSGVLELKKTGLSPEVLSRELELSEFNFQLKGKTDFSFLSQEELHKIKIELAYISKAYLNLKKRYDFVRGEENIVVFSSRIPKAIDIGSTRASRAKFWTGFGVLEESENGYVEKILSPKQYYKVFKQAEVTEVDFINLKNFSEILVFNQNLNF